VIIGDLTVEVVDYRFLVISDGQHDMLMSRLAYDTDPDRCLKVATTYLTRRKTDGNW
jgi:hypothetical protein